jgi:hypothetical protein
MQKTSNIIRLNVGGVQFVTSRSTLDKNSSSFFTGLLSGSCSCVVGSTTSSIWPSGFFLFLFFWFFFGPVATSDALPGTFIPALIIYGRENGFGDS